MALIAVIIHVTIALTSLGYATYVFMKPSKARFYKSYGLITLTVATGTYLVWSTHSNILHSCVAGLVYLGAVSVAIVPAHVRLAHAKLIADKTKTE